VSKVTDWSLREQKEEEVRVEIKKTLRGMTLIIP
jgi:hypothetical protein